MSMWVVARVLRLRGVQTHFAAAYAWRWADNEEPMSDSCGIFLIGPATSTKPLWDPDVFRDATALPVFLKGQGYQLASYLPRKAEAVLAMRETFAPSTEGRLTRDWEVLPPAVQKRLHVEKFDPNRLLFRGGAHMPLLVFLGDKGRRAPEAIQRRELKARERRGRGGAARARRRVRATPGGQQVQSTPAIAGEAGATRAAGVGRGEARCRAPPRSREMHKSPGNSHIISNGGSVLSSGRRAPGTGIPGRTGGTATRGMVGHSGSPARRILPSALRIDRLSPARPYPRDGGVARAVAGGSPP